MVVDSLEKLHYQLARDQQLFPKHHLYLIFDGLPEIVSTYFLLDDAPEYLPLFINTHLEDELQCSPYIVCINLTSLAFIEWFYTAGLGLGFFYFSPLTIEASLSHWQKLLFHQTQDNTDQHFMLRFYETSVFEALINNQELSEFNTALAPCSTLYFQTTNKQWIKQKNTRAVNTPAREHNLIKTLSHTNLPPLCIHTLAKRCEISFWESSPEKIEKFHPRIRAQVLEAGVTLALSANIFAKAPLIDLLALWLDRGPLELTSQPHLSVLHTSSATDYEKIKYLTDTTSHHDSWKKTDSDQLNQLMSAVLGTQSTNHDLNNFIAPTRNQ
ncbi:hypothetical protein A9Q99_02970 [Gammaproteobacteria bacterium 45_16_T64]|nr:hypothetical protein A9Q99_02970 [Gammaproteobacteria bacterium 45_16_T64]